MTELVQMDSDFLCEINIDTNNLIVYWNCPGFYHVISTWAIKCVIKHDQLSTEELVMKGAPCVETRHQKIFPYWIS